MIEEIVHANRRGRQTQRLCRHATIAKRELDFLHAKLVIKGVRIFVKARIYHR